MALINMDKVRDIDLIKDRDAKVYAAAVLYAEAGFYVIPIRPNGKAIPGKSYSFNYHSASKKVDTVKKWYQSGGKFEGWNIGLATGREGGIFVVDLDKKKDVDGIREFDNLTPEEYVYNGPVQFTPSGGQHLIYNWRENAASSTSKIAPGIDTRGGDETECKGHIVAWPSVVDGVEYTWATGGETPDVPQFILEKMGRPWRTSQGSGRGNEFIDDKDTEEKFSIIQIRQMLSCIDLEVLSYDEWLSVLMAIHSQHPTKEGLELATEWSAQEDRYIPGETHSKWSGFNEGGEYRIGTIIHYAKMGGYDLAKAQLEKAEDRDHLDAVVDEMNKEFAVVPMGSDIFILQEIDVPPELKMTQPAYRIFKKAGFKSLLENKLEVMADSRGNPVKRSWADIFLAHENRRFYPSGLGLFPNRDRRYMGYYNMWEGFSVQPQEGDWSLFYNHVRDIICDGNGDLFSWVLDWMADLYQDPGNPKGCAIVMHGVEGCGKGTFAQMLGAAFGTHFKHITDEEHLIGRFNGHLADCILAFGDEVTYGGNRKVAGKLKALVTEKYLVSERKGIDAVQFQNCTHLLIASNESWFIPAGPQSRRWLVLDVAPDMANNQDYFKGIQHQMKNGGLEAMLHDLLQRKIVSNLNKAPETKALQYQRAQYANNNPTTSWISAQLSRGKMTVENANADMSGAWPTTVLKADMYEHYNRWCQENKRRPDADVQFGKQIHDLGFTSSRIRRGNGRVSVYKVPTEHELREALKSKGIYLDLEEEDNAD